MQPNVIHVQRSVSMAVSAPEVFEFVNNFHKWNLWSPWIKLDPNTKVSFEGAPEGKGAIMHWGGDHKVGEGSMTIIDSQPNQSIALELNITAPFRITYTALVTFSDVGNQTTVTWSMSGENSFISKALELLLNCKKLVGIQFEQGLANLKKIVESKKESSLPEVKLKNLK